MDGLSVFSIATGTTSLSVNRPVLFPLVTVTRRGIRHLRFTQGAKQFVVSSSNGDAKFDQWELMELEWGRLRGEDPQLTLAKIMGKKDDPYASDLEIEKQFYKNKKKNIVIEEVPFDFDFPAKKKTSSSVDGLNLVRPVLKKTPSSMDGLNLVRPVLKKGAKFQDDGPVPKIKKPNLPTVSTSNLSKSSVPNVILRKPTIYKEDTSEDNLSSLRIKPNLSLKMRDDRTNDKFSDMTLLRRPAPTSANLVPEDQAGITETIVNDTRREVNIRIEENDNAVQDLTLLKRPEAKKYDFGESSKVENNSVVKNHGQKDNFILGMQPSETERDTAASSYEEEASIGEHDDSVFLDSGVEVFTEATLQGKPIRLDSSPKDISKSNIEDTVLVNYDDRSNSVEFDNLTSESLVEDNDWNRAEDLLKSGDKENVELLSSSSKGFAVYFGSLVGFLPYRNLATRWKFLAFESWLRQKGLNPSVYRQNLGVVGRHDVTNKILTLDSSIASESDDNIKGELSKDTKLEDLLKVYDQEKLKFLSSFVGQRVKANVIMADRKFRKLIFSMRPKEKEEYIEKKKTLMSRLSVGDIVKCYIKKIAYFGIFVEVEGVPALIHQTEVSWDATLDPSSYFRIGQVVEAKVHQLDFALERIFLSLKELTQDPLIEALDSMVGDRGSLDGQLVAAEADTEWADVESLIKELQQLKGIESVSKGGFFLSPGLAPTFQVYMTPIFENQYKLLARSGNRVQELIVEASLDKEDMRYAIQSCTNRVDQASSFFHCLGFLAMIVYKHLQEEIHIYITITKWNILLL